MTPATPPGQTETVRAETVLVLAPHADDEVLGCGGLLAQLASDGAEAWVWILTDGAGGRGGERVDDPEAYAARRDHEADQALAVLGARRLRRAPRPDGELSRERASLVEELAAVLLELEPDLLLVPSPLEVSADHRAAFEIVHELLAAVRDGHPVEPVARSLRVLLYEVNHALYADLLVDVSQRVPLLEQAMACYASQQERHDYLAAGLGRRRFRTLSLPPEVTSAEAYRRLELDDFRARSRPGLLSSLGAVPDLPRIESGPRISVIVRTKDRPELLAEALDSLAKSTYRPLEVVLVNDGGAPPMVDPAFPFELVRVDFESNRGRAAAANAGVEAATGEYVAFLDDDDLVDPDHYQTLVGLVAAAGVRVAYTDAAVGVYRLAAEAEGPSGWCLDERRLPYSRDFDPELLLVDNYIPFHTLLVERRLFAEAGPFEPDLPFFEDWDFLLRLAALVPFHHLARVTCEYRQFRGAGHHVLGDRPRARADFLDMKAAVLERHRHRLEPAVLARVVDGLRAETVELAERLRAETEALAESRDRYHALHGRTTAIEQHNLILQDQEARSDQRWREERARMEGAERDREAARGELAGARRELQEVRAFADQQGQKLGDAYAEIERLTGLVEQMRSSRAWKMHESIQRWKSPGGDPS